MSYEKIGTHGPVIIGLHGWGQNLDALKPLATLLSDSATFFLFDLPGFGKASAPDSAWSSFDYADHIMQTMHSNNISSFSVIGHSFGGKIAMSLAVQYPESIDSLVLMASSGLIRKRTHQMTGISVLRYAVKMVDKLFKTKYFLSYFVDRFGSRDYKQAQGILRQILVKTIQDDFSCHLQHIKCPTLILWGKNDDQTPVEMAERLQAGISQSKLLVFDHKDHYLLHDCGYHLCAYYIKKFFGDRL